MKEKRFRTTLAFALGALIVQFLLGMAVNLFVKIPHQDFSSLLMAVGFALAMSAYAALLYRAGIATPVPEL
jgi:heme A synthase